MDIGDYTNVFCDWITASQYFAEGGLPIISGGLIIYYDSDGNARHERNCAASLPGSYETSLRIACDGYRLSISGNVGRFERQDNFFNLGWEGTKKRVNSIFDSLGLPNFSSSESLQVCNENEWNRHRGAVVSRLDITTNFSTGNESQARDVIRWIASKSISRMKKGRAGDESVWWANTRYMLKAYIKHHEMAAHGIPTSDFLYQYSLQNGVVRVELELKKRLLSDLTLNQWGDITQEKLEHVYRTQTELLRQLDRSDEPDLLDSIPLSSRAFAAAWLDGRDVRDLCSRATLYRHAKILRSHGIDLFSDRSNLKKFPVKVRVVDLSPLDVPDWYIKRCA